AMLAQTRTSFKNRQQGACCQASHDAVSGNGMAGAPDGKPRCHKGSDPRRSFFRIGRLADLRICSEQVGVTSQHQKSEGWASARRPPKGGGIPYGAISLRAPARRAKAMAEGMPN